MQLRYNKLRDENGMLLQDKEVMKLLLRGKRREEIAGVLSMPLGTVNTCCARIYELEGVKSLPELMVKYAGKKSSGDTG